MQVAPSVYFYPFSSAVENNCNTIVLDGPEKVLIDPGHKRHWPALAATAGRHFQISKEVRAGETYTLCRCLAGGEVLEELARMGGGGEQGLAFARALQGRQ